jgi:DNA-binding NarL/FixJ family response regulator
MTVCSGRPAANSRSAQGRTIAPLEVLIVAELSTCTKTIHALLELQDFGFIQIIGRVESGVELLHALTVLVPNLIILDHRQRVGSMPLSSVLASNFPAIKLLCFAEEDSVRLVEASPICQVQVIFSKTTLRRDLAAALEQISGFSPSGSQLFEPQD